MTLTKIIGKQISIAALCAVASLVSLQAVADTTPQPQQDKSEPRDDSWPPIIMEFCPIFPQCQVEIGG